MDSRQKVFQGFIDKNNLLSGYMYPSRYRGGDSLSGLYRKGRPAMFLPIAVRLGLRSFLHPFFSHHFHGDFVNLSLAIRGKILDMSFHAGSIPHFLHLHAWAELVFLFGAGVGFYGRFFGFYCVFFCLALINIFASTMTTPWYSRHLHLALL